MGYLNMTNGYEPTGQVNREPINASQHSVVTICGSMRFYLQMLVEAARLTREGWIVLMPFAVEGELVDSVMLDRMHRQKMDMADTILFVTDRDRHMGESTRGEMQYAKEKGMTVVVVERA